MKLSPLSNDHPSPSVGGHSVTSKRAMVMLPCGLLALLEAELLPLSAITPGWTEEFVPLFVSDVFVPGAM